ncbi:cell envelope integrity protein TolA [Noviherbaspirillum cavernae]|uniref:Cell envelope integrity protein TolA n=1 Tax=Noviherbaspirillum cavernae TaxID=2320862 RepID=A0A418X2B3_9BURK|nr:cell envelope integrity protein TolA [Noviherbaspirillum cavernae]RJG06607.1 cell envelope integrity protein TolA [Noviherbaspirillum cavernae]
MTDATPYTVPKEPGRWRAITLAALVHLALLVFLWIGIRWQNETPVTIEAEVWSPQVREAAPLPEPPTEPQPEPQPVIKETPPQVIERPVEKPELKQPDIALEQEKKRKAELEKKRLEEQRLAELKEKKRLEEQRLAELKEKKRLEEERLAQLKQKQDAEDKRLEKEKSEKAALAKKAAEDKKRKQDEADAKLLAKMRDEDMRRITGGVTGTGGSGDAPKSQGGRGDGSYAQRVAAKIKSNITFNTPEGMDGNPAAEFEVNLLPDGSVAGIRKRKSSGIPGFDEAVGRAIEKSQPYPKDKTGSVPSSFIGIHKPKDQ